MLTPEIVLSCITEHRLRLILMPTEACNFRCVYCYEDFAMGRMKRPVIEGVRNLLTHRAPELDDLRLSWLGGEPLLAHDIIEEILEHVAALQRTNPRLQLASDITTNGSRLTPPLFERLVSLGVSEYHISFDGPKASHDQRRVRVDGTGSFDVIWSNVEAMARSDSRFLAVIRLHVDAENHEQMPAFLDQFREAFGKDPRFRLFVRRISALGGPNDRSLPLLKGRRGDAALAAVIDRATDHGLSPVSEGDVVGICSAAKPNSFVIRSDGRLNKCSVALRHPDNQVGVLTPDGELELDGAKVPIWRRGLVSGDPEELICPAQGLAGAFRC